MDKLQVSMVDTNTQSSESLSESCLGMFADNNIHSIKAETPESELNRYLNSNEIIDPIKFWTQNKVNYPRLSIIANKLFCIPATNLSSERNFNYAGLTLTDRRSSLDPDNVDKLLFVRSNYDLIVKNDV